MKTTVNPLPALKRAYARAHAAMTRGDGYQPFGYDWPTLRATKPEHAAHLSAILSSIQAESRAMRSAGLHPCQTGTPRSNYVFSLR